MATERVARTDAELWEKLERGQREEKTWKPSSERNACERHDTKLHQAEMLAHSISGSDDFEGVHPAIRSAVLWLLADLITESREAKDEYEAERRAQIAAQTKKEAA